MLKALAFFASEDKTRIAMHCVRFEWRYGELRLCATNGLIVGETRGKTMTLPTDEPGGGFSMGLDMVKALLKFAGNGGLLVFRRFVAGEGGEVRMVEVEKWGYREPTMLVPLVDEDFRFPNTYSVWPEPEAKPVGDVGAMWVLSPMLLALVCQAAKALDVDAVRIWRSAQNGVVGFWMREERLVIGLCPMRAADAAAALKERLPSWMRSPFLPAPDSPITKEDMAVGDTVKAACDNIKERAAAHGIEAEMAVEKGVA